MGEPRLPGGLVEDRRTPLFDYSTLPDPLATSHRTTVKVELRVQAGTIRYVDIEGDSPRDERVAAGEAALIVPGVEHHVDPSTDARFYIQFFREPDAAMVPGSVNVDPWTAPVCGMSAKARRLAMCSSWSRTPTYVETRLSPLCPSCRAVSLAGHAGAEPGS